MADLVCKVDSSVIILFYVYLCGWIGYLSAPILVQNEYIMLQSKALCHDQNGQGTRKPNLLQGSAAVLTARTGKNSRHKKNRRSFERRVFCVSRPGLRVSQGNQGAA